jgi:acyl-CoA ligase (AMP-forming) (exosortase A-associated)
MTTFVHELISYSSKRSPQAIALQVKENQLSYSQLNKKVMRVAQVYSSLAINDGDRVGIYLVKNQESVQSIFACSVIGAVFVPINPVLKSLQVQHIANDCQIKLLVTNHARLKILMPILAQLPELVTVIVIDADEHSLAQIKYPEHLSILSWQAVITSNKGSVKKTTLPMKTSELAAILYTSGSTGKPKGIMLSHANIILGAKSVSQYLELTSKDNILTVLPLSFDYGLNQLMSCFVVGAKCILLDYLLANDVIKAISKYNITGLAAVPPLWIQLTKATWPDKVARSMRYFTNSGGVLPLPTLVTLRKHMPQAKPYLMYGLTEAFRSTFLPPAEIDNRPSSIGKAIPHAEVLVLREDGSECDTDEVGELVHIGPLVTLGYWQNTAASEERFKKTPERAINAQNTELAVFSGDYVKRDADGYLYFVSRKDAMIKTSGYRVSPTELESVLVGLSGVDEAAVIATPSKELGQAILALIVSSNCDKDSLMKVIIKHCQVKVPNYMIPKQIIFLDELPRNTNGKVDTKHLSTKYNKELPLN